MIRYKDPAFEKELRAVKKYNKPLYDMVLEVGCMVDFFFSKDALITSVYRDDNPDSVHYHWRGVDLRSWLYTDYELSVLEIYFNSKYIYDPDRRHKKVLLIHDVGKGNHIHIQNHPNTIEDPTFDFMPV